MEEEEEEEVSEHGCESENNQMSEPSYHYESDAAYLDEEDSDDDCVPVPRKPKLDRISVLPDSIIHHILSFLPTTKDAVKTGVLSKRWQWLWTSVPNLIFHHHNSSKKIKKFFSFIDKTLILYSSSKIKKFVLDFDHKADYTLYTRIESWLRFALRHDVDELCLEFSKFREDASDFFYYDLPQFFFNNSQVVIFKSMFCDYMPVGKVCWNSLKILSIKYGEFSDDAIDKILQGSPVLECFELHKCNSVNNLDITSKSLKKLVINGSWDVSYEEDVPIIEISAPNLQSLEIMGHWCRRKCRLMNVSSLVNANLSFELTLDEEESNDSYGEYRNMLKELLEKVNHVKELTLGTWCIQVLSISVVKGLRCPPLSNCKCLILDMHLEKWNLPGLASLLRNSPKLEKLVIDMSSPEDKEFDMHPKLYNSHHFGENYWTSMERAFKCLMLHLKTIEIVSLQSRSGKRIYAFLQFLLGNAKVLEKMVITDNYDQYGRNHDIYEVAQKLVSFPRSSPRAIILLPK